MPAAFLAGSACWVAGRGKAGSRGATWALAGLLLAGVQVGLDVLFGSNVWSFATLHTVNACLLLLAITDAPAGIELWRSRIPAKIALVMVAGFPMLFLFFDAAPALLTSWELGTFNEAQYRVVFHEYVPRLTGFTAWVLVSLYIERLHTKLFPSDPRKKRRARKTRP